MAFKSSKNDKMFNEINITPLTDIFLVLLIIMMVVAPTFQSNDNSIQIPKINSGLSVQNNLATVSITKDGNFFINGNQITEDDIQSELEKLKPNLEKKEVVVRADSQTKSSEIMKVMKAATEAQYEKLTVAGEPLSKKEQEELLQ
ncbi:MAG: biopolymer transporter ExbD [Candidatus Gastranaerophilales bacterium]|nr:biopolymer transporter ExbD [Candidatus Gastranaerophilales bacterium]